MLPRVSMREARCHILGVAGEIAVRVQVILVVEIHDEGFVLRIAGLHKRHRGGVYLLALFAHAAAVIDHQAHGYGNIFASEDGNILLDLFSKTLKSPFFRSLTNWPASSEIVTWSTTRSTLL